MGGSAFTVGSSPLFTPRMPRNIYNFVKTQCHTSLRQLYLCVASPIDGPGKKDFGDVDILVAWPKKAPTSKEETMGAIATALQAPRIIVNKGEISAHIAIPWPKDISPEETQEEEKMDSEILPDADAEEQERFIQVDVRVCDSLEHLQWMLFKHAHGDIWNLLGTTIRPFGLTVDDNALWIRVPEIEHRNRKRAKIHLSSEPVEILQFLGLPIEGYWEEPFPSLEAMFEYATKCRLFWVPPPDPDQIGPSTGLEDERKKLKANDRRRMSGRPGFRIWIEEFKPKCREQGRFVDKPATREQVAQQAFERFHVEAEYTARRDEFLREDQRDIIWREVIKGCVPEVEGVSPRAITYRSCLLKALKKIILEDYTGYGVSPEQPLKDEKGFYKVSEVVDFITRNQDEIGHLALERSEKGMRERMQSKAERKAAQEEAAQFSAEK